MNLLEIREQAAAVRAYWRARPNVTLSAEGAALLSMIEGLPRGAVLVDTGYIDEVAVELGITKATVRDLLARFERLST